jgi:hypothetical protein
MERGEKIHRTVQKVLLATIALSGFALLFLAGFSMTGYVVVKDLANTSFSFVAGIAFILISWVMFFKIFPRQE